MKSEVRKFNELYYNELFKLQRRDLAKILHKKQGQMLKNVYYGTPSTVIIDEIEAILKRCCYNDKLYFVVELYQATLEHVFWMHENNHKTQIKKQLITAVVNLVTVKILKMALGGFKECYISQNPEQYESASNMIKWVMEKELLLPDNMRYYLTELQGVISGDKKEWEIYNTQEHISQVKNLEYETFIDICDDIYQDETTFTDLFKDAPQEVISMLTDYLNSDLLNQKQGSN